MRSIDIKGKRLEVNKGAGLIGFHLVDELRGENLKEVLIDGHFCFPCRISFK